MGTVLAAKRAGVNPTLHPKATAALEELAKTSNNGEPLTLQNVDTLRQIVKDAAASNDAGERRIAQIAIGRMDNYMSNLTTKDVLAGNPQVAVNSVREARSLWSRMRKSELFDDMQERARNAVGANYTSAGYQTAVRQQVRALLNNKKQLRGFTNEEKAALSTFVRGGPIENVLRLVGKFSPQASSRRASVLGAATWLVGRLGPRWFPPWCCS